MLSSIRVAIDIGGTFTDIVVMSGDGTLHERKVLTTPDDPSRAVVVGLSALLAELLQMRTDCVAFAPYGLEGGEEGGRSRNFIEIGNRREPLPGTVTMMVPHNAAIIHEQAGAGGFGDPDARDPALVLEDLLDGKITAARAASMAHLLSAPHMVPPGPESCCTHNFLRLTTACGSTLYLTPAPLPPNPQLPARALPSCPFSRRDGSSAQDFKSAPVLA